MPPTEPDPVTADPQVSLLVPTLNEAENVDRLLTPLVDALQSAEFAWEILIVDGGSTDGTPDRVEAWVGRANVRLFAASGRNGLSGDVLEGAEAARGDVIVVMDADLSHPPSVAPALARAVLDDKADMAIGSRYIPGGGTPGWPLRRRFASRFAAALAWPLVNVHDPMSGFFAVRRDRLRRIDPAADGFKIGLELLVDGRDDLRVREIPIVFHDRTHGSSKLSSRQVTAYLRRLAAFAGSNLNASNVKRFAAATAGGLLADFACFEALFGFGLSPAAAHLLSFTFAAILVFGLHQYWTFAPTEGAKPAMTARRVLRFLGVGLLALVLRGPAMAISLHQGGGSAQVAIIVAAIASALVLALGSVFFIFAPAAPSRSPALNWRLAAVVLVAYSVLLRICYLGLPDLIPEEAYYWNYAQHLDLSYLDHPPMVAWLITAGTAIFGNTELGVRLGAVLCWIVAAFFSFGLARNLYGKTAAIGSLLLIAAIPYFFVFGFFMTPDSPLIACWAAALYFLERATIGRRRLAWWGVGVAIGVGMLSKYTIALLGPAGLAFVLLDRQSRRWFLRPEPYAAAILALALFSPVVLWNARHDWASFAFQGSRRWLQAPEFSLHLLIGAMLILFTPLGLFGAFQCLLKRSHLSEKSVAPADLVAQRRLFLACFLLVPLSVFVYHSLSHPPKINWTGPIWLVVLPALAVHITRPFPAGATTRETGWSLTIFATLIGMGGYLHYVVLGLPGVGYPNLAHLPVAWEEMGAQVEMTENDLERRTGSRPLVVGMDKYFIASELAFYRQRDVMPEDEIRARESVIDTSGRHLVTPGDSLMYDYWSEPEDHEGRTLLMVSFDPEDLVYDRVEGHFRRLDPVQTADVRKHGRVVGQYYYRFGYGYRMYSRPKGHEVFGPTGDTADLPSDAGDNAPKVAGAAQ